MANKDLQQISVQASEFATGDLVWVEYKAAPPTHAWCRIVEVNGSYGKPTFIVVKVHDKTGRHQVVNDGSKFSRSKKRQPQRFHGACHQRASSKDATSVSMAPARATGTKRKAAVSLPPSESEIFQVGQHVCAEHRGEWCKATIVKAKSTSRHEVVEQHPRKKKSVSWAVSLEELRNEKPRLGAEKQEAMKRARPSEDHQDKEASALPDPTASATTTAPEEPGRVEVQFATKDTCFAGKKEGVIEKKPRTSRKHRTRKTIEYNDGEVVEAMWDRGRNSATGSTYFPATILKPMFNWRRRQAFKGDFRIRYHNDNVEATVPEKYIRKISAPADPTPPHK
jgi:hypothetical protein